MTAPRLLLVDDDERLRARLLRALRERGLPTWAAADAAEALGLFAEIDPTHAVIDLRMPGRSGMELLAELRERSPGLRVVVLTGYGSIASAVASMRQGAIGYLAKPADADQILSALELEPASERASADPGGEEPTPSLARVEWEHIQRVLSDCGSNVSRAARVLGVHRRTLQRKLGTLPPRR